MHILAVINAVQWYWETRSQPAVDLEKQIAARYSLSPESYPSLRSNPMWQQWSVFSRIEYCLLTRQDQDLQELTGTVFSQGSVSLVSQTISHLIANGKLSLLAAQLKGVSGSGALPRQKIIFLGLVETLRKDKSLLSNDAQFPNELRDNSIWKAAFRTAAFDSTETQELISPDSVQEIDQIEMMERRYCDYLAVSARIMEGDDALAIPVLRRLVTSWRRGELKGDDWRMWARIFVNLGWYHEAMLSEGGFPVELAILFHGVDRPDPSGRAPAKSGPALMKLVEGSEIIRAYVYDQDWPRIR